MARKRCAIAMITLVIIVLIIKPSAWSGPLMSPEIKLDSDIAFGQYPDTAYNPTSNQYLVVWQAGSQGLRGRFVRSGETMGNEFEITEAYQSDGMPRVAFDSSRMRYLVVWNRGGDGGYMYGRFIPWNGPSNDHDEFIIDSVVTAFGAAYGEYSVAYSEAQDEFFVVWVTRYVTPSTYFPTVGRRVRADGSGFVGTTFFIANQPPDNRSYAGVAYNSIRNEYLVSTHDYPKINDNIYGTRVTGAGSVLTEFTIAGWPDEETRPAVTACPELDQYMVVWDSIQTSQGTPYPRGVYARFVSGDGTPGSVKEIVRWDHYNNDDTLPDVACGMSDLLLEDPRYLAVYRHQSELYIWGREIFLDGTMGDNFLIWGGGSGRPAVAGGRINHLVAWAYAGDIYARFIGNTEPNACFSVDPEEGNSNTEFIFDASCSTDATQPFSALQVRWDWNNDDIYETTWSTTKTISHRFTLPPEQSMAVFYVQMQVTDGKGGIDAVTNEVIVHRQRSNGSMSNVTLPSILLLLLDD
jgi:hypothetical protein